MDRRSFLKAIATVAVAAGRLEQVDGVGLELTVPAKHTVENPPVVKLDLTK